MARNVPTHVLVLDRIAGEFSKRLQEHRVKVGRGLDDKEYQRHVGRIAELELALKDIAGLRKQLGIDGDID